MIDRRALDYRFDEERSGFRGPPVSAPPPLSPAASRARGGIVAGTALTAVAVVLAGRWQAWPALLLGPGLLVLSTVLFFRAAYGAGPAGIRHDGMFFGSATSRGAVGWTLGILITGFYVLLYWFPGRIEPAVRMVDPLSLALAGRTANQWFLYGTLYTVAVLVFGTRMLVKYRHSRYQRVRTASVMFFQLGFAFILPNVLKAFHEPEFYFTYFWPLKPEYLWPAGYGMGWILDSGRLGAFMIGWGAVMTFVATPVLTYFFGKRWYCSWVCGCGGLAETLGDPFRQLSTKSTRSWMIERVIIYSVLALVVITSVLLWINHAAAGTALGGTSSGLRKWYGFYIGALFSGVIGVGFYPILGSRVWCRFGCPMAAVLGIWQKLFSRFRITTNGGQCMSCGNCSTYCEMGIDVRAYAQRGVNIVRASCVGCGICAAVCPRGALKLENGAPGDRYPDLRDPFQALARLARRLPRAGHYLVLTGAVAAAIQMAYVSAASAQQHAAPKVHSAPAYLSGDEAATAAIYRRVLPTRRSRRSDAVQPRSRGRTARPARRRPQSRGESRAQGWECARANHGSGRSARRRPDREDRRPGDLPQRVSRARRRAARAQVDAGCRVPSRGEARGCHHRCLAEPKELLGCSQVRMVWKTA